MHKIEGEDLSFVMICFLSHAAAPARAWLLINMFNVVVEIGGRPKIEISFLRVFDELPGGVRASPRGQHVSKGQRRSADVINCNFITRLASAQWAN